MPYILKIYEVKSTKVYIHNLKRLSKQLEQHQETQKPNFAITGQEHDAFNLDANRQGGGGI